MRTYSTNIYPTDLVVASSFEEMNAKYRKADGADLVKSESSAATTYKMFDRKTGYAYVGIVLYKKPSVETIAHESFHAAQFMLTYIQQDFVYDGTNEAWAYLIGWIALCIENFADKKYKKG